MPNSKPRPIHTLSREIRETPDQSEPSYSYEDKAFIGDLGDDVEDEFHRRLSLSNHNKQRDSGGGGGIGGGGVGSSSFIPAGGGSIASASGGSSFWRTDSAPLALPSRPVTLKERKSSGGLLGAAMQLHSQSSTLSDDKSTTKKGSSVKKAGVAPDVRSGISKGMAGVDRKGSGNLSQESIGIVSTTNVTRDAKKSTTKQRSEARRLKLDSQLEEVDIGHVEDVSSVVPAGPAGSTDLNIGDASVAPIGRHASGGGSVLSDDSSETGMPRSTSVGSTGSGLFSGGGMSANKAGSGALFGKGSSLLFPTGIETPKGADDKPDVKPVLRQKINLLLDQCESVRWPYKKKLMLSNLGMNANDIPIKHLCGTKLGDDLVKLSLMGNALYSIPPKLVTCLPTLKTLDLSQCQLHKLPERWKLPQLKRLNLSHNRLVDFPEESMLEGLSELTELNMYGNKVSVIVVPHNPMHLAKLETLNLGYNDLAYLPDELDRLTALRTLKLMNNMLEKIPMRICDMELKVIDVSSNPVIQPPVETCDRGVQSMKRYYMNLRMEAQTKEKAMDAFESKRGNGKKNSKGKSAIFNLSKISFGRKNSDADSSSAATSIQSLSQSEFPTSKDIPKTQEKKSGVRSSSFNLPLTEDRVQRSAYALDYAEDTRRSKSLSSVPSVPELPVSLSTLHEVGSHYNDGASTSITQDLNDNSKSIDDVTVNDTLKVIFVGMAMAGKTSMIKRLIEGQSAVVPKRDERTVGVDIYEWNPKDDKRFEHIDSRINFQDKEMEELCGDVNVKFSVWDFAGQHVYHATHELFFSPRALYVLVWDMAAANPATKLRKNTEIEKQQGAFSLNYDSDGDSEDDDDFTMDEEFLRADRALKRDIDDKIQFWVDCIQTSAPGAAILPVASFDDLFTSNPQEATRRCNVLKERLLEHEQRRVQGIMNRLSGYIQEKRANDEAALRLRKLLNPYSRPKLIFGQTEDDAVVRVSGSQYTGFAQLTERIINIATGRERAQMPFPIFRGHVGARIPRMRIEVREAVRKLRDRFKVVEWGYFISQLQENGITNVEDISDALHFLTSIGELSYFGGALNQSKMIGNVNEEWEKNSKKASMSLMGGDDFSAVSEDDDMEDATPQLSLDNSAFSASATGNGLGSSLSETLSGGLSQYVFLNPRWLVAAVACILRHDLDTEIQETRRARAHGHQYIKSGDSFYEANMNCPVITAEDACMLWQAKKFTKKAAERVEEYSNNMPVKPFEFLQLLLVRFGVFVPIDLGIEKAFLGGTEYAQRMSNEDENPQEFTTGPSNSLLKAAFFFLPSLLGPGEPTEAWTYKSTDSWKATICHSVLFPDGVPPGLMERITASVLSNIYALSHGNQEQTYQGIDGTNVVTHEGHLTVKEVLCWRTAFLVKVGMQSTGESTESIVEVFCGVVDKESHLCVGSDSMVSGMRRLITSGKGQEGDGGRKIWKGGYLIVLKAVQKVMDEYGGLEYEKHGFCPDCLSKRAVAEASYWDFTVVRNAIKNGEGIMRCSHGHRIDTRLVAGPLDHLQNKPSIGVSQKAHDAIVPIHDLLRAVVLVGLWDATSRQVVRVGSGFIADKRRGLIVTAAHTLMNIWGERSTPFGENYYGIRHAKVVIGIIPKATGEDTGTEAVFRYNAKIVAKDPSIEQGECHVDACILKITTRMENDVGGNGEDCGDQPEDLLYDPFKMKQQKLHQLKITDKCELDEQVRIVGYNQGGEGLLGPGVSLNRYIDFARGYVCKKFAASEEASDDQVRHRFRPREEIVLICPTIGGHSGGACVNQGGEVIGILSRADPAENQRCYLVPTSEWRSLLIEARNAV